MKRSQFVELVLVTTLFASCGNKKETPNTKNLFVRTDTTSEYSVSKVRQNEYLEFDSYDIYSKDSVKGDRPVQKHLHNGTYFYHYRGYHNDFMNYRTSSYYHRSSYSGYHSSSNPSHSNSYSHSYSSSSSTSRGGFGHSSHSSSFRSSGS